MSILTNSHGLKAENYDKGRVEYPKEFFDYLYNEVGFDKNCVIADIGCGTGKITKNFLERGNKVFAVELDEDMISIANKKLSCYHNYIGINKPAENSGISSNSIDHIFCGNSYHWFEREKIIKEFRRILHKDGLIVIATLGVGSNEYSEQYIKINDKYKKTVMPKKSNNKKPFKQDSYIEKSFEYSVYQTFEEFLSGALSASYVPNPNDSSFNDYCEAIKLLFNQYSINGKLKTNMKLSCMIGSVSNLDI